MPEDWAPSVEEVVRRVADALDRVGVDYAVGGSIASSVYGEPRSSQDVDFAIRIVPEQVPGLVSALGPGFEVDEEALLDAVRDRRSWNIFYLPFMLKIDLFVRAHSPFDESEFARRRKVSLVPGGSAVYLSSPEDNLLWKLRWFRMGGEVSDQQWRDIEGIVRVSGASLDRAYLDRWAAELGISDLLGRALIKRPKRAHKTPAAPRRRRRKS